MSGEWNYQRFFSHPPVIMFLIKECWAVVRFCYHSCDYKQLLDEIFVISRIIKVEVRVINRSRTLPRPWLFWISQKPNLTIVLLYIERKKMEVMFLVLHWREATQSVRTWHDYTWPWVSLTWLLYNLQLWRHGRWFRKFTVRFRPIRKELDSSMYHNRTNWTPSKVADLGDGGGGGGAWWTRSLFILGKKIRQGKQDLLS